MAAEGGREKREGERKGNNISSRHRSLKLLRSRMENGLRDGNLGSGQGVARDSGRAINKLLSPPPHPSLPTGHFHSRNDEATFDCGVTIYIYSRTNSIQRATYSLPSPQGGGSLNKTKDSGIASRNFKPDEERRLHIDQEAQRPLSILIPRASLAGPPSSSSSSPPPLHRGRNPLEPHRYRDRCGTRIIKGALSPRRFTRGYYIQRRVCPVKAALNGLAVPPSA